MSKYVETALSILFFLYNKYEKSLVHKHKLRSLCFAEFSTNSNLYMFYESYCTTKRLEHKLQYNLRLVLQ